MKGRPIVVKTYGTSEAADFYIKDIATTDFGLDLNVVYQDKTWHIPLALAGTFQAINAVAAAIMCHLSGLPLHDSLGSLSLFKISAGTHADFAWSPRKRPNHR